jgi:hypothetical protein
MCKASFKTNKQTNTMNNKKREEKDENKVKGSWEDQSVVVIIMTGLSLVGSFQTAAASTSSFH